jgi:hypothetical protein
MTNMVCSKCKDEIKINSKFFYLAIKERGNINSKGLELKLCSFKCLEQIIANPSIIIVELL